MAYIDALGTRIRERRNDLGVKQADLARAVGISASYLNLIEHNRRRIGGKLLNDIAERLEIDPSVLSEGAEAALLSRLRLAAADPDMRAKSPGPEVDRVSEFAGRFPGWAGLMDHQYHRIQGLQAQVDGLSDRLAQDANLSQSLHEVLTTAAAIRSTADILAESEDIDPNWRRRFHMNIQEESHRLSDGSQALVAYLDRIGERQADRLSAQEELDQWLSERRYHVQELEDGGSVDALLAQIDCPTGEGREMFARYLNTYAGDAVALPLPVLWGAIETCGLNPLAVSQYLEVSLDVVLRRLATLPDEGRRWEIGRVACDGAGYLTFRKPIPGFVLPRQGSACPLWPLFRALMQPHLPVAMTVRQLGHMERTVQAFALAQTRLSGASGSDVIVEAQMVLIANDGPDRHASSEVVPLGQTCQVCPRVECQARRERSVFSV